ncbi:hypothetical protein HBI23_252330 [Parastagonospora nodorum]|nr:hypothetical protein HBI23_252330 [Parastagonospora nodorum]KAH5983411.1 hypothetical protein HBI84_246990 [Parastagonospora nodorum]KAH6134149.1 hypothetical protein HBI68_251420 [Parastagonospora nodorum]KAH6516588.1 hypothetical protein HBI07_248800 [Parastagonospora nodorum]
MKTKEAGMKWQTKKHDTLCLKTRILLWLSEIPRLEQRQALSITYQVHKSTKMSGGTRKEATNLYLWSRFWPFK